jgi:hypothetical protein
MKTALVNKLGSWYNQAKTNIAESDNKYKQSLEL